MRTSWKRRGRRRRRRRKSNISSTKTSTHSWKSMRKCSPMTIMVNKWCTSLPSFTYKLHKSTHQVGRCYIDSRYRYDMLCIASVCECTEHIPPQNKNGGAWWTWNPKRYYIFRSNPTEKLQNLLLIAIAMPFHVFHFLGYVYILRFEAFLCIKR